MRFRFLALAASVALSTLTIAPPASAGMVAVFADVGSPAVHILKKKHKRVAALKRATVHYAGHYARVQSKAGNVEVYAFGGVTVRVRHGGSVFVSVGN